MAVRVLVVDDEQNLRRNLVAFLEDESMEVSDAGSLAEAVCCVGNDPQYDVCVMDMRLPDADGNAAILRLDSLDAGIRFLIHTGTAGYTVPEELKVLGLNSNCVFLKPLPDMEPLARAIERLAQTGRYDSNEQ